MSFREEIKSPFNLLMLALAIIGLLTAFYFYYFPKNERGIAYEKSNPSLIYDSSVKSPKFSLVDSLNKPITANTYLISYTFWNDGSQTIEPNDIRRPIAINFLGMGQILDYKIVKSPDQDICNFTLSLFTNKNLTADGLQLNWNHFDPRKGVSFQIIVCQTNEPNPVISADIVGINELSLQKRTTPKGMELFLTITFVFNFICALIVIRLKFKGKQKVNILDIFLPFFYLAFFGYYIIKHLIILSPPF